MSDATVLSVVVPCFDAARQLPTTLASADRNTTDATEWLFVDDGSSDGTPALLAGWRPSAGTVRVLRNETPTGVAAARERGLREARGRYIAFLDADDWYAPGHLPRVTAALERLDVDFVRTDHTQVTGTERSVRRVPEGRRGRRLAAHDGIDPRPGVLSAVDAPNIWAGVYRRELAERGLLSVDAGIRTAEDRLMVWRLHLHAGSFAVLSEPGYCYRREVAGSLTAIGDERQLHFFDAYDTVLREIDATPTFERFRPKAVRTYVAIIAHHEAHRVRLQPAVHRRFTARARERLRSLPQDLVDGAVHTLSPDRARIVERLR